MISNHIKLFAIAFLVLPMTGSANPLHEFAIKGNTDGLADYIRDNKPPLEKFLEVDLNGETPLDIAMRLNNSGLIEALARTTMFLTKVKAYRGHGLVHPVHAFVERGDTWGVVLYLTYFEVTHAELMNDRHGRSIFEIARETGNVEMINLITETVQPIEDMDRYPLRELRDRENTVATNPQADADDKGKEEDNDEVVASVTTGSDDENSNLIGSDDNGLFFNFEDFDNPSPRASAIGLMSPRISSL